MRNLLILLFVSATSVISAQELIPFLQNNKYGYSDPKGNLIIKPQFDNAELFETCGLAYVQFGEEWNMVSRTGKIILPKHLKSKPEWRKVFDNENIGGRNYSTIENAAIIVMPGESWEKYSWGLYSGTTDIYEGGFRFKLSKDSIEPVILRGYMRENEFYPNFINGFCFVEKEIGEYNYLGINGKFVLSKSQKNITYLNQKYFSVENERGTQDIYDYNGRKVLETDFRYLGNIGWESKDIVDDVFITFSSPTPIKASFRGKFLRNWGDQKGLIDINGEVLLDTAYRTIIVCNNRKAIVWKNRERLFFDLDKREWIEEFEIPKTEYKQKERDYSKYERELDYKHPKENFEITTKIFENKFDTIYEYGWRDTFIVRNKSSKGVLDTLGNIVLPFIYSHIRPLAYGNFFKVREYGKSHYFVVDRNNKIISNKELHCSWGPKGNYTLFGDGKTRLLNLSTKKMTIFDIDGASYFRDKNYRWHPFLLEAFDKEKGKQFYINYKTGIIYRN